MSDDHPTLAADRAPRRRFALGAAVFLAACVMGLPAIRGGFVGGDDHRLALNHVLVNHPSFEHALEIFTTFHRDLYQPLPLLSFQAEFAMTKVLGLYNRGPQAFAWLFHLDNVLLHAFNTVLVWLLVLRLHRATGRRLSLQNENRRGGDARNAASPLVGDAVVAMRHRDEHRDAAHAIAAAAALLFAIHPLQTEVVAWLNGRMFLMSTFFALASLLSFSAFLDRLDATGDLPAPDYGRRNRRYLVAFLAVLTLVLVLCSSLSKVRGGLVALWVIVALAHGTRLQWRVVTLWCACVFMTLVFLLINIRATSEAELFSLASEHLQGPRAVRVLLALSCYFQHFVWPVGLASYYPTPPLVRWTDPTTWRAALIVLTALLVFGAASWRSRTAMLGIIWFFAAIADTLPVIPARNVLAADRYMYLPIIGLAWAGSVWGYRACRACAAAWLRKVVLPLVATAMCLAMVGICWHVASFYESSLKKTGRVAQLFPDIPRVAERLGWSHYKAGDYARAIDYAKRELTFDIPAVQSGAYQLMGMSELKRGRHDQALSLLHKAIRIDPKSPLGMYRLAMAYDELGRIDRALPFYEAAVEAAPSDNPTICRLASAYRGLGRTEHARTMFEKAIKNNPYEVPAIMGLAELDIERGTAHALLAAETRLLKLLDWMPENLDAQVNLGAVYGAQGRPTDAANAYRRVLRLDPNHATACLNLAQIHYAAGDLLPAAPLFERAVQGDLATTEVETIMNEFHHVHAAYVALVKARYLEALAKVEALCAAGQRGAEARARLLRALERFGQQHPDNPWVYCLVARIMIADARHDAARVSIELCERFCADRMCRDCAVDLRAQLTEWAGQPGDSVIPLSDTPK